MEKFLPDSHCDSISTPINRSTFYYIANLVTFLFAIFVIIKVGIKLINFSSLDSAYAELSFYTNFMPK